jgi:hypothetical protein
MGMVDEVFRSVVESHDSKCGGHCGSCPLRTRCQRFTHEPTGLIRQTFEPSRYGESCEWYVPIPS